MKADIISGILKDLDALYPTAGCALEHGDVYQLLISVVLSAQTTDVSVNKVTPALFAAYPDAEAMAAADPEAVMACIRTIGMYRQKSKNIIALSARLIEDYGGNVPDDFEELIKLPGVGRKTANVVLAEGFGIPALAVDTHVFRVSNRIGLVHAEDVNGTEEQLKEAVPRDMWIHTHHLLIFHGRYCCRARKPECGRCPLRDRCEHPSY